MATLLLTAVGTAVGGPIGGAVGAFIGRQADQALFGTSRQGPRLKELTVTTSSYGQPLPRNFGRMRVAGSIIWSTELQESKNKQGGSKGKPSTTTYSYSVSFAVALSSTPIERIGRIWADGNLLRGAAGDLKVAGDLRFYPGKGDSRVDPLIAADRGALAPAFRDVACVVFEDLQLADFGNRIPALTFEIFSENGETISVSELVPSAEPSQGNAVLDHARGYLDEGGSIGSTLATIDQVFPLVCTTHASGLRLESAYSVSEEIPILPEQVSIRDSEDAQERHKQRGGRIGSEPIALRYYDEERDYQPSVQRALGIRPDGRQVMVDLPAAMNAQGARQLANSNAHRARWRNEHVIWRIGELNPDIGPGHLVRLPNAAGIWLVKSWEWSDFGVELSLDRVSPEILGELVSDSGASNAPADNPITPTQLFAFEAPAGDNSNPTDRAIFAAATSQSEGWRGAALFIEQGTALQEIGQTGSSRAVAGTLTVPLGTSLCTHIEPNADILVHLNSPDLAFQGTDVMGLSNGANRLMVGGELIQFLDAQSLGNGEWRLSGLLRGRAGTEPSALVGHDMGTSAVLLDDRTTTLNPSTIPASQSLRIAAIGLADDEPVFADLQNVGLSRRAIIPIAPLIREENDGAWKLCWTRRARGQWTWPDGVEVPLVEEQELYSVGYGPCEAPFVAWPLDEPQLILSQAQRADLLANYGPGQIWVKQIGSYGESPPLLLAELT
ncbi:phage tail protein [uncultured Erythrobacter sp.]|uniref:phage tail protein n=1 Tax=uncultured Erythrobacter sp. TaxID=263913 RepID=UPI002627C097|nr:phage tail protein [uncultured Erythrobacter sp.]